MPRVIGKGQSSPGHWWAEMQDDEGVNHVGEFDHDPTNAEVLALIPGFTKGNLEDRMRGAVADLQMWTFLRDQAVTRSAPAAVQTALSNRADAAWTDVLAKLNAWRQA